MQIDIEYYKNTGDSPWWRYMLHNIHNFDVEFVNDAGVRIYEPNISLEIGNQGIDDLKDASLLAQIKNFKPTVFSTVQEPISAPDFYWYHECVDVAGNLQHSASRLGLDVHDICYASGDYFVNEFNTSKVKSFFVPGWNHLFWQDRELTQLDPTQRDHAHTFLSFNRIHKPHRMYFLTQLLQRNMLNNNLVSCADIIDGETFVQHCNWIVNDKNRHGWDYDHGIIDIDQLLHSAQQLQTQLPMSLDVKDFMDNGCYETDTLSTSVPFYQNSTFSVITESNAVGPGCYISEAIFRPLIFQQPFFVIGQARTLEVLREWGFDTFDDVLDNSYDTLPNQYMRTQHVLQQLQYWNSQTPRQRMNFTLDIRDRLLYNREHYYSQQFKNITRSYFEPVLEWISAHQ